MILGYTPGERGRSATFGAVPGRRLRRRRAPVDRSGRERLHGPDAHERPRAAPAARAADPPIDDPELARVKGAVFVEPEVVCEIEYARDHEGHEDARPGLQAAAAGQAPGGLRARAGMERKSAGRLPRPCGTHRARNGRVTGGDARGRGRGDDRAGDIRETDRRRAGIARPPSARRSGARRKPSTSPRPPGCGELGSRLRRSRSRRRRAGGRRRRRRTPGLIVVARGDRPDAVRPLAVAGPSCAVRSVDRRVGVAGPARTVQAAS